MTTLEKAVRKAVENGYTPPSFRNVDYKLSKSEIDSVVSGILMVNRTEQIIFNHQFAKALWGDARFLGRICRKEHDKFECNDYDCETENISTTSWVLHLQAMVIAEDPIKYLGEHLDD